MKQRARRRREKRQGVGVVVVIEMIILGLVAMGVYTLLIDQYDQAQAKIVDMTVEAKTIQVYIAMQSVVPPTNTPTRTRTFTSTPTRTSTPTETFTSSTTPLPSSTRRPTSTPRPSATHTPVLSPTPSIPPTPSEPPAPTGIPTQRPTRTTTPLPGNNIARCSTIDDPGNYHLSTDLSTNGDCIKVQTSNVVIDCDGHAIRGTNFTGSGVAIRKYGLLSLQSPSNVEVRNCHISNFKYGIFAESGSHLVIRNNESSNNFDDTDPASRYGEFLGMTEGGGIRLNHVTDSQVLNNTTVHQAIGIDIRSSSGIIVRGNTSSDNSAWGINFGHTQNSEASGNTTADNIRKCTWSGGTVGWGCDAGGIALQDGSNSNMIANNMITGRNGNGVFIKAHAMPCGSNNSIIGNTINSVLYNSVELGFCTGNKINNNQMHEGLDGVWLGFAHDTEIKGNVISNMSNHGIISWNSHNNTISGNQIINSNEGLYFYSDDYDRVNFAFLPPGGDYRSHDNCLCGNNFQSNSVAVHLMDSTNNQVTGNSYSGNARTFWVQGNSDGNNLQGNAGWWLWPWTYPLARRYQ